MTRAKPNNSERLEVICDLVFELKGADGPDCKLYWKRKRIYDKLDKVLLEGKLPRRRRTRGSAL